MSELTIRPALITKVIPESIADEVGFEVGDRLVAINGKHPRDLIDYQFLCADEVLKIEALDATGKTHQIEIEKDWDEDLGLEFETALFDGLMQCNNKCPFCFIDQQPPGKRQSLYFKDDDYRLSFLYGSYLTLTNLTSKEWERIEQMRLSPLYVSVHATEPEIRSRLLKNPRAGQILQQLQWFQERRLQIHAQVVVCPGINDGIHLERTLLDLASFATSDLKENLTPLPYEGREPESNSYSPLLAGEGLGVRSIDDEIPTVASVAVVPVGLTKFRPTDDELTSVTPEKAAEVIIQVQAMQEKFRAELGTTFAWLADEWFLIADRELPPASHYEDYPQIGNGVGSIRKFIKEFQAVVKGKLPKKIQPSRKLTWIVGNAVEKAFLPLVERLNRIQGLEVNLVALASQYWGQQITVTGLLTGEDLLHGLAGKDLGDRLLVPSIMLKHDEPKFLDDLTVEEVAQQLGTPALVVNGVEEAIAACLERGKNRRGKG
jgi:NifB/MoaA-like Fe-S oxidoreductase